MTVSAYPLQWPDHIPRTERKADSKFKTTLGAALDNVQSALRLFGQDTGKPVTNIVLSSNVSLGNNKPADTGIAAWFVWDGQQVCIAVDRYPRPEDNLQAIYHIVEARRTEMRHGGLHIVRATFRGFQALPSPPGSHWSDVLGISRQATREQIEAAYRHKAKTAHPDTGGSSDAMARLNAARDAALKAVS